MKKKESIAENQSCTCPNPSCGKVFTVPIKVENLCSRNAKVYSACPFCLTEITLDEVSTVAEEKKEVGMEESESKSDEEERPEVKVPDESLSEVHGCAHHLGYLSQRSPKESIPEECMVCEKIVQCMLKNVTS
jgi:hypothetical protein